MGIIYLFGETHGYADDLKYQKRILKKIVPKYYLYEMLENKSLTNKYQIRKFLLKKDSAPFSIISSYEELKPTIRILEHMNLPIIGCDIKNMGRKNNTFLSKTKLSPKEKKFEQNLLKKREKHQAKTILEYSKKSEKSLFASVGAYHLRKQSHLIKYLKNYKVILYMPNYNNKYIIGPKQGMNPKKIIFKRVLIRNYLR